MAAGSGHSLYLKTDGTLWAMGWNGAGQLGDGTTTNRSTPLQVAMEVADVTAGASHSLYLKMDGTLWAMGKNDDGQLGNGTTAQQTTPVPVATGVASMAAGVENSLYLKTDGSLWAMGYNAFGQLGDGTTTDRTKPVRIAGGLSSAVATLQVNTTPAITTQPSSPTATIGFPFSLSVSATGIPSPTYLWKRNGVAVGGTSATFTVATATSSDAGTYTVEVSNPMGTFTSTPVVVVVNPAAPAAITTQPANVTASVGESATLSVAVSGSPSPSIQWYRNGTAISGATTSAYTIASVAKADAATYTATVSNVYNGSTYTLTTSPAVLTVIAPPVFAVQPLSQTTLVGAPVTFTAAVQGLAATTFQWRRNGTPLSGATAAALSLASAALSDTGTYTVVATNSEGSTTSHPAELVVNAAIPPAISGAPASVTVPSGERTQLKVSATGTGPLSYQWYQGTSGSTASPVAGATAALFTTPSLTTTTSYWVRITDANGSVTNSPTATVTVSATSPLTVTQVALGAGYVTGGAVVVTNTITYTGTAPSRIDWATLLPAGWKYLGSGGSEGGARPVYKNGDLLEWTWTTVPPSPIEFSYMVSVPAGTTGDQVIASLVTSQASGTQFQTMAKPDPLVLRSASLHTADTNRDGRIGLLELTRVIELYNYRSGGSRTGQYKPKSGTEDGFDPGP
jgi:hypothetical protein